jgi:hypothetical protein
MGARWIKSVAVTCASLFIGMSSCSSGVAPGTPCGSGSSVSCGGGSTCVGQVEWLFETDGATSKGCNENNEFCSLNCGSDDDCAPLGPNWRCVPGCNGGQGDCDDHPTFP